MMLLTFARSKVKIALIQRKLGRLYGCIMFVLLLVAILPLLGIQYDLFSCSIGSGSTGGRVLVSKLEQHGYDPSTDVTLNAYTTTSGSHQSRTAPAGMTSSVPICTSSERLQYIKAQIARHGVPSKQHLSLLANDDKRLAVRIIRKCASSSMEQFLVLAGGKYKLSDVDGDNLWRPEVQRSYGLRRVDQQSLHTIANHRKIVVVRNPMDRFVSAFNDLIILRDPGQFRQPMRDWLPPEHRNATLFQQFTKAILSGFTNTHWQPQASAIRFQDINYDDVIRMESFRHDLEPIVTGYLGLEWSTVSDATRNVKRTNLSTPTDTVVKPRRLPILGEISKTEVRQLKEMYRSDFDLLGYDFDVDSLTTSCKIVTSDGKVCC